MVKVHAAFEGPQTKAEKQAVSDQFSEMVGQPKEIVCPISGEIIEMDNADSMIDAFERLTGKNAEIYAILCQIRRTLGGMSEGTAKTRRVRGKRRLAKIEMPDRKWDQSLLKEAFNSYPQFRDDVLKIDSIGVKLVEFKKLKETTGEKDYETFRSIVVKAEQPSTADPKVTVEQ